MAGLAPRQVVLELVLAVEGFAAGGAAEAVRVREVALAVADHGLGVGEGLAAERAHRVGAANQAGHATRRHSLGQQRLQHTPTRLVPSHCHHHHHHIHHHAPASTTGPAPECRHKTSRSTNKEHRSHFGEPQHRTRRDLHDCCRRASHSVLSPEGLLTLAMRQLSPSCIILICFLMHSCTGVHIYVQCVGLYRYLQNTAPFFSLNPTSVLWKP